MGLQIVSGIVTCAVPVQNNLMSHFNHGILHTPKAWQVFKKNEICTTTNPEDILVNEKSNLHDDTYNMVSLQCKQKH